MKTLQQTAAREQSLSRSRRVDQGTEEVLLLSIGSIDRSYALEAILLDEQDEHRAAIRNIQEMRVIPDYRELWLIPRQEAVHLAVVHDTLTPFELDETCRFIRHQWPSARILIIRAGEISLDDALYDDRVVPNASAEVFSMAIARLFEGWHK